MLRNLLAAGLGLFLSFAPLSAQSAGVDPVVDCTNGRARGTWNLPVGDQAGFVRGLLVDVDGRKLGFEGRLGSVKLPDGTLGGRLEGTLFPLTNDRVRPAPIAVVHGSWVAGELGRGRFEASIVELTSGRPGNAIGKLAGVFADPQRDRLHDPIGSFSARWAICR